MAEIRTEEARAHEAREAMSSIKEETTKSVVLESKAPKGKVIFGLKPEIPYAIEEAVNRLRINISFLGSDVKKILIISSEPNEGKSFVAMNLWSQMARAGEKTILIDCDMRNSTMKAKYDLTREDGEELKGTSHYLAGNAELDEVILSNDMNDGDLMVNADNIINPSMLLEHRRFEAGSGKDTNPEAGKTSSRKKKPVLPESGKLILFLCFSFLPAELIRRRRSIRILLGRQNAAGRKPVQLSRKLCAVFRTYLPGGFPWLRSHEPAGSQRQSCCYPSL